jgi:hypothetical protein
MATSSLLRAWPLLITLPACSCTLTSCSVVPNNSLTTCYAICLLFKPRNLLQGDDGHLSAVKAHGLPPDMIASLQQYERRKLVNKVDEKVKCEPDRCCFRFRFQLCLDSCMFTCICRVGAWSCP